MRKTYKKHDFLQMLVDASINMHLFYKQPFINYSGCTADTKEPYTEVISEWLLDNIYLLHNIPVITRKSCYFTPSHTGIPTNSNSNRKEELIAMAIFRQHHFDFVGNIIDYQTPLKNKRDDKAGKIDVLSYDGNVLRILELKKPDSPATMLRCVLEGYTYLKTLDRNKFVCDFKLPFVTPIKASPLVFRNKVQHSQMKNTEYLYTKKLMKVLDSKPFFIHEEKEDFYSITEDI
jgi:hypothetical protein